MKKTTLATILILAAVVLSACGAAGTGSGSASSAGSGFRNSAFANRPLTPAARLALGTIKLEGTPQAVDPAEAAKLLPLWQLLAQVLGSSSSAPQEVNAVLDQIKANMNQNQVKSIGSMQLSSADIASVFQQLRQGGSGQASDPAGAPGGANGAGGGARVFFGGGGFPGGGGGFGGGFGANRTGTGGSTTSSTTNPAQAAQQASNQISLVLANQVVQLLQSRVKS